MNSNNTFSVWNSGFAPLVGLLRREVVDSQLLILGEGRYGKFQRKFALPSVVDSTKKRVGRTPPNDHPKERGS